MSNGAKLENEWSLPIVGTDDMVAVGRRHPGSGSTAGWNRSKSGEKSRWMAGGAKSNKRRPPKELVLRGRDGMRGFNLGWIQYQQLPMSGCSSMGGIKPNYIVVSDIALQNIFRYLPYFVFSRLFPQQEFGHQFGEHQARNFL